MPNKPLCNDAAFHVAPLRLDATAVESSRRVFSSGAPIQSHSSVDLTEGDLRDIESAASQITVQGARYSEGAQRTINR
jgi:hypothetical protein